MRIFSISTEGLKSLRSRELTELEDLSAYNVLIGPNNAGKSALLESIQLLRAVTGSIPVDGVYSRDPPADTIRFELGCQLSPDEVGSLMVQAGLAGTPEDLYDSLSRWAFMCEMRSSHEDWPPGQAALRHWWLIADSKRYPAGGVNNDHLWASSYHDAVQRLVRGVASQAPTFDRDWMPSLGDWRVSTMGPPLCPAGNKLGPLGSAIQRFAGKIRRLESARVPSANWRPKSEGAEDALRPDAENLAAFLHSYFSKAGHSERHRFNRAFHRILPDLHGFRDHVQKPDVKLRVAPRRGADAGESYDIRHVGGAARQVLCILAFVWSAQEGDILLVEEPELNLHPSAQRNLSRWLLRQARDRNLQIVLSTHSTIFVRQGPDCRTYLVTLDPQRGTVTKLLEEQELGASSAVLGMRQAYVFGYDVCLLVQGNSEERAMPLLIEAVASVNGIDSDDLGIWLVNLRGAAPKKAVEPYLEYIRGSPVKPYVVLDDDQGVRDLVQGFVKQGLVPEERCHIWEGRRCQGRSETIGSEFEDNFTDEQLVWAANQLAAIEYAEEGMSGQLSVEAFRSQLKESTAKTSEDLQKYYVEVFGTRGWSKPALNEMLARQLANKIQDGDRPEHAGELIEVCQEIIRLAETASQSSADSSSGGG